MLKRVVTAIFLIILLTALLGLAPVWLFKIAVILAVAGCLNEYYRLVFPNDLFLKMSGMIFGLIFAGYLAYFGLDVWIFPLFMSAFFILILSHMAYTTVADGTIARLGLILFGTLYLAFTLPVFVWMREILHGRTLIVMTIAIVAVGDSFAYGAGKLFGRRKMSPLISPKKTMEGFAASFVGGVLAAVICWKLLWPELPIWLVVFTGLSVAFIGAFGDLIESLVKRAYHVKDSGNILPGHGGILDRLDAELFAAPFVYFVFKFLGWI